jgi:hypothetical protein
LGEGPALEYAARDSGGPDPEESVLARQRMTRLVEVAQVADARALHPQAQRLLADVQVMLNLTERYEDTADADRRLPRADRHDLPPCITRDRSPLDPGRSTGPAKVSEPGSNVRRVDGRNDAGELVSTVVCGRDRTAH